MDHSIIAFFTNINSVMGVVSIFALIIMGGFAVFSKTRKQTQDDSNRADDRLVSLLKDQVDALEKKVETLEKDSAERQSRMLKLETRNELLEQIFQGRDAQTQLFQQEGFLIMNQAKESFEMIKTTNQNVEKLYKAIEKHMAVIEATSKKPTTVTVV